MTLNSMTGFGRAEGQFEGQSSSINWSWELRAVNGKGLDVRLRLPGGHEQLEQVAKKQISQDLSRGNVQAVLSLGRSDETARPSLNEDVLESVLFAIETIEKRSERAPSTAAEILSVRGVFDVSETELSGEQQTVLNEELLQGLKTALAALNDNRAKEGGALADVLRRQLDDIEQLTQKAETDPSRTPTAIAVRLDEQLKRISNNEGKFDTDRLHQEVALLATKADIREELDRLVAHIAAAKGLIDQGSPVGRKLEFLAQEFNRESNTLCSKSNAVSLTSIGLELKVVIDQFREQILNVE